MKKHQKMAAGTLAVEELKNLLLSKLAEEEKNNETAPEDGYQKWLEGLGEKEVVYLSELSKKDEKGIVSACKKMGILGLFKFPYILLAALVVISLPLGSLTMFKVGLLTVPAFFYFKVLWWTKGGWNRAATAGIVGLPIWLGLCKLVNSMF